MDSSENKNFFFEKIEKLIKKKKYEKAEEELQNIILNNILLYRDGIDTDLLYQRIWKRDKSIQINKLDTHITNLKNKVKEFLKIDLTIISSTGIIKLIID